MSFSRTPVIEERWLHPVGMLLSALTTVRRWAGLAAFPGIAALVNGEFGMRTLLLVGLAFLVLALLSAVWGVLSWRATTYRISGGAFHLKRGVLQKSERSLPLEHVQSVNTVQGIVQRVFGVVELRLEAAGGAGEPEVSLSALSRPAARGLREELTRSRKNLDEAGEVGEEPSPTVLRKLSTGELLVAGLTSGQIGVAVSVVAGGSQILDNILPAGLAERLSETLLPRTLFAALLLVLFVALFAWLLAIFGTVLAHAGFTLSRSADGKYLHIKRGLLNRYETTVPIARIQAVRLVEGALRQPLGLAALRVESAGFGTEEGVSTVLFPLLRRSEAEDFLSAAAPLFAAPLSSLAPLPARARGRYAFRSSIPALVVAVPLAVFLFPWGLLALLLVPPAALYGLLRHRAAGYALNKDRVVLRTRRLARTTVVAPRERLQSRGYSVSPIQKRRDLATLEIEVASGRGGTAFRLVDLASGAARGIVDALSTRAGRPEEGEKRPA
jgi:putative membrane protein